MINNKKSHILAIDLGTTTIAMRVPDDSASEPATESMPEAALMECVFENPQRVFGEDVISRMEAASKWHGDELREPVLSAIGREYEKMLRRSGLDDSFLDPIILPEQIIIGGNTAMIHILMGYDCTPLMTAPFTTVAEPPSVFPIPEKWLKMMFPTRSNAADGMIPTVRIIPWLSAFIGGDIVAGLRIPEVTDAIEEGAPFLFIDLGTNGEMVLYNKGECYATATAAGPAFEGGKLSCGCAAVDGAIRAVRLQKNRNQASPRPHLETIGNHTPIGLCGCGAVSMTAELIRKGYVNTDSTLAPGFPSGGIPLPIATAERFTADDLHEVLLAKAAIAAGIDTLLKASGLSADDICKVLLAGGLGYHIAPEDCDTIRLFGEIPSSRIHPVGNACLSGLSAIVGTFLQKNTPDAPAFHNTENRSAPGANSRSMHIINLGTSDYFKERFIGRLTEAGHPFP